MTSSSPLRVMTYNVHSCVGGDRRYDPERILKVLREIDADIIALQEVGGLMAGEQEQASFFADRLGMSVVAGPSLHRRKLPFGNALLVRGEIIDIALVDLTVMAFAERGAIDCLAETRLGPVRILAAHLGLFAPERRKQIALIASRLAENPQPLTVLLGDFNIFGPERRHLQRIGAPMPMPKVRSFPARRPMVSLDRIWTIPNNRLVRLAAHRTPLTRIASDHVPLVGTIEALVETIEAA